MQIQYKMILALLCNKILLAQNLVPNSSFEIIKPSTSEIRSSNFGKLFDDWYSACEACGNYFRMNTPGLLSLPKTWAGFIYPHSGNSCVAIFANKDMSEYVGVKLNSKLLNNHFYCLTMHISSGSDCLYTVDEIDYALGPKKFYKPRFNSFFKMANYRRFISRQGPIKTGRWSHISSCYLATGGEEHLLIGLINPSFKKYYSKNRLKEIGAYIFIDDVSLVHINDTSECGCDKLEVLDSMTGPQLNLSIEKTLVLKQVNFEANKSDLLPVSFKELTKIADYLKANKTYKIEISGHTDSTGNEKDNLKLSRARSNAVSVFLQQQGIEKERISCKGFGSSVPLKANSTEGGKLTNRRVEIKILK